MLSFSPTARTTVIVMTPLQVRDNETHNSSDDDDDAGKEGEKHSGKNTTAASLLHLHEEVWPSKGFAVERSFFCGPRFECSKAAVCSGCPGFRLGDA